MDTKRMPLMGYGIGVEGWEEDKFSCLLVMYLKDF